MYVVNSSTLGIDSVTIDSQIQCFEFAYKFYSSISAECALSI